MGSEIYWKIAENQILNQTADLLIILNSNDQLVETPFSNIYIINGESVRSPGSQHGACVDVTRRYLLEIFKKLNLNFSDADGIFVEDLNDAEEAFVVNSVEGIRWIAGFESKRYFNNTTRKISELFRYPRIS
jgi:branched-chain amino acid aminotransferase